ncbi:unnamed protein product, partial [marine sediment metagenome]
MSDADRIAVLEGEVKRLEQHLTALASPTPPSSGEAHQFDTGRIDTLEWELRRLKASRSTRYLTRLVSQAPPAAGEVYLFDATAGRMKPGAPTPAAHKDSHETAGADEINDVDINAGTIDGVTIGGAAAPTVTDLGTVTTCDIDGGSIDGVTIGGAAAPTVTDLGTVT